MAHPLLRRAAMAMRARHPCSSERSLPTCALPLMMSVETMRLLQATVLGPLLPQLLPLQRRLGCRNRPRRALPHSIYLPMPVLPRLGLGPAAGRQLTASHPHHRPSLSHLHLHPSQKHAALIVRACLLLPQLPLLRVCTRCLRCRSLRCRPCPTYFQHLLRISSSFSTSRSSHCCPRPLAFRTPVPAMAAAPGTLPVTVIASRV